MKIFRKLSVTQLLFIFCSLKNNDPIGRSVLSIVLNLNLNAFLKNVKIAYGFCKYIASKIKYSSLAQKQL